VKFDRIEEAVSMREYLVDKNIAVKQQPRLKLLQDCGIEKLLWAG
jgi:hypothetical protein